MIVEKHNGYTNYWTWCLASTIDNKESLYNRFHIFIRYNRDADVPNSRSLIRGQVMNMLRKYSKEACPHKNGSFWDSITNDIEAENINYYEIAENMLIDEGYPDI